MLNITENTISDEIELKDFKSYNLLRKTKVSRLTLIIFFTLVVGICIFLFLPWTQNINAKGYVTTRSPEQRPQAVQSVIGGRIEKWYVQEGDFVEKGDTIIYFSEIKSEYFDPNLIERTSEQVEAKSQSIESYNQKVDALQDQFRALEDGLGFKREQTNNKIIQVQNKIKIDSIDLIAYQNNLKIAENQFSRTQELYDKGLKSLSELQEKELKVQSSLAKVNVQKNKFLNQKNELANFRIELLAIERGYAEKLAKSKSDQQSALSSKLESVAATSKLKNKLSNYSQRQKLYYLTAPQSGYITKILKKGIGESVKAGSDVLTIMPEKYDLAVEIYIKPQDLPLLYIGNEARLRFDGWPAIVISGWPESSTGIFEGQVITIDRFINEEGYYRVLITGKTNKKQWPERLRVGTGTNAFILLKDVPIWYEIWRQLNGFPPEFYEKNKKSDKDLKRKAPIKSVK